MKIIAKVLANRLAPKLTGLVGIHQYAFVRGKTLHDNFMLVLDTNWMKEPTCLLNLDTSKAFDPMDWSFLLQILGDMSF